MNIFLRKVLLFLTIFILFAELLSRLLVDPFYFWQLDTYNLKRTDTARTMPARIKRILPGKETKHVDYLFIGSSRVPAAIDDQEIMEREPDKTAVVAGRGYLTPGIHYQALKKRLEKYPGYLQHASVFIELPGSRIYETAFSEDEMMVYESPDLKEDPMPHLILPYIGLKELVEFIRKSHNSFRVKARLTFSYCSSLYRSVPFIKEKIQRFNNPMIKKAGSLIASGGGIRNDHLEEARAKAMSLTKILVRESEKKPLLTPEDLDVSTLAHFNRLIKAHGGRLCLFKMPLHSVQKNLYSSEKERKNEQIFNRWLHERGIEVIANPHFHYADTDFPDIWHLSISRRKEFTALLMEEFHEKEKSDTL